MSDFASDLADAPGGAWRQPAVDMDNLVMHIPVSCLEKVVGDLVCMPHYDPHPLDGMKLLHFGPPYLRMAAGLGGATARALVDKLCVGGLRCFAPDETNGPSPVLVTASRTVSTSLVQKFLTDLGVLELHCSAYGMKAPIPTMLPLITHALNGELLELDLALSNWIPPGTPGHGINLARWPDVQSLAFDDRDGSRMHKIRAETFPMW